MAMNNAPNNEKLMVSQKATTSASEGSAKSVNTITDNPITVSDAQRHFCS